MVLGDQPANRLVVRTGIGRFGVCVFELVAQIGINLTCEWLWTDAAQMLFESLDRFDRMIGIK